MRISTKLFLFAAGIILLFLIVGSTSYICVSKLIDNDIAVDHSKDVLNELNMLMYNVTDTINTQRAYIITGNVTFLEGYHQAAAASKEEMIKLRNLIEEATEKQKFDNLASLINERLASLDVTLQILREQGREAAIERVRTGRGLAFRMQLHNMAESIKTVELNRLSKRQAEMMRSANSSQMVILSGAALALVFASFYTYLFAQQVLFNVGRLLNVSTNLEHGRFDVLVEATTEDEFAELAAGFNRLGQKLRVVSDRLEAEKEANAKLASESDAVKARLSLAEERLQSVIKMSGDKRYSVEQQSATTAEVQDSLEAVREAVDTLVGVVAQTDDCLRQTRASRASIKELVEKLSGELRELGEKSHSTSQAVAEVCADAENMHEVLSAFQRVSNQLDVVQLTAQIDDEKAAAPLAIKAILRKFENVAATARQEHADFQRLQNKLVYACQKLLLLDRDAVPSLRSAGDRCAGATSEAAKLEQLQLSVSEQIEELRLLASGLHARTRNNQAAFERLVRELDQTRTSLGKIALVARESAANTDQVPGANRTYS